MTKRVQNLERLCQKMQARYGAQDSMVIELMEELSTLKLQIRQVPAAKPTYQYGRTVRPKADLNLH
jgi:phage shock protein A